MMPELYEASITLLTIFDSDNIQGIFSEHITLFPLFNQAILMEKLWDLTLDQSYHGPFHANVTQV